MSVPAGRGVQDFSLVGRPDPASPLGPTQWVRLGAWQETEPVAPGLWLVRCDESDQRPTLVKVMETWQGQLGVWVECQDVGTRPMSEYHNNLRSISWRKMDWSEHRTEASVFPTYTDADEVASQVRKMTDKFAYAAVCGGSRHPTEEQILEARQIVKIRPPAEPPRRSSADVYRETSKRLGEHGD